MLATHRPAAYTLDQSEISRYRKQEGQQQAAAARGISITEKD
jgi:hypothetical protein